MLAMLAVLALFGSDCPANAATVVTPKPEAHATAKKPAAKASVAPSKVRPSELRFKPVPRPTAKPKQKHGIKGAPKSKQPIQIHP
jgi:hypothetical protein